MNTHQQRQQQMQTHASGTPAKLAQNQMATPTGQPGATVLPSVDIFEDENGFVLMADMPGVTKDQLVVRMTGDSLLIEGAAAVSVNSAMELIYGQALTAQYRRSFTLSRELDPGKIEAELDKGVLTLRIPKAEEARPRRIKVSVG